MKKLDNLIIAKKKYDGLIINAAGFTHTSVAIRDALAIFKKPSISPRLAINIFLNIIQNDNSLTKLNWLTIFDTNFFNNAIFCRRNMIHCFHCFNN